MGHWKEPHTFKGVIQSWYYQAGDGRSLMSLHVPSVRDNQDFYVVLITRGEIEGYIELHASSHEEAKIKAPEAAQAYLQALSLEAALAWMELR
jgi:hypothetical protein